MSDALNYLVRVRPDAMKAYLAFLKQSGTHLDPKTRNLISVITKVHAQTENGLRQYLTRALREGASANEVLDALLCAFPALGLAKIVWAVDIILSMDIPEFRPATLGAPADWHRVCATRDLPAKGTKRIECEGRNVFVHREGKSLTVYDTRCPHQVTDIPDLALKGGRLTCPKHGWAFDIADGACVEKGNRPLNRFEHRVKGGILYARW
ncbi:MAG: Rieske 2Fe-2S domain-containing protein [Betaproteobacteria bacterium]|nr:Rieske 2Fe-2S domain-containing protein [Betaproteobacteria bacterium]